MKNAARGNLSGVFLRGEFNSLLTRGGGLHSEMRDQDRVPQMPVPQPVSWETDSWSPAWLLLRSFFASASSTT